jgi:hypothetical protein
MTLTNQLASFGFGNSVPKLSGFHPANSQQVPERRELRGYAAPFILDMSVSAIAAGVSATAIPAACSASIFPAAVPFPPEMIAPA